MAKVKQPSNENTNLQDKIPAAPVQGSPPGIEKTTPKPDTKVSVAQLADPDELVLGVLRAFFRYETLYVDRHGGAFPSDTDPAIRSGAVLYRNPFYKS